MGPQISLCFSLSHAAETIGLSAFKNDLTWKNGAGRALSVGMYVRTVSHFVLVFKLLCVYHGRLANTIKVRVLCSNVLVVFLKSRRDHH